MRTEKKIKGGGAGWQAWKGLSYFGFRFECPVCGGHFRKMLSAGIVPREHARCPACGSLERHRLLWLFLRERTNLFRDRLRVLHIAPNRALEPRLKRLRNLDYISADIRPGRASVQMDITRIPEPDHSFDVILCSHVLEHIPEDRQAMRELFRVLKPGGWAILQVPILCEKTVEDPRIVSRADRERVFGHPGHVRKYGRDYENRLKEAGFEVFRDGWAAGLKMPRVERYRIHAGERICLCMRPAASSRRVENAAESGLNRFPEKKLLPESGSPERHFGSSGYLVS